MRWNIRNEWLPIVLLAATWAIALWYLPHLPATVPTHWGLNGRPNGWMPRPWGALVGPVVATAVYMLLQIIPSIDPRRAHWEGMADFYGIIKGTFAAFLFAITWLVLAAASHPGHHRLAGVANVAVGLLFIVLGNYLPKTRSNFFFGIRTPWTLSDESNWTRTNRVAGYVTVAGGIVIALSSLLSRPTQVAVLVLTVLAIVGISLGYSFWLFRHRAGAS